MSSKGHWVDIIDLNQFLLQTGFTGYLVLYSERTKLCHHSCLEISNIEKKVKSCVIQKRQFDDKIHCIAKKFIALQALDCWQIGDEFFFTTA